MILGRFSNILNDSYEKYKTNISNLDIMLGGGLPKGRITHIIGNPQHGKTDLCARIAEASTGLILWVDSSGDIEYNKINSNSLIVQPEDIDQLTYIAESIIDKLDLLVIDSLPGLVSKFENNEPIGDNNNCYQIVDIIKLILRLSNINRNATIILVNQYRSDLKGHNIIPYHKILNTNSKCNIILSNKSQLISGNNNIGYSVLVNSDRMINFNVYNNIIGYSTGISLEHTLLNTALHCNIITRSGSRYYYNAELIGISILDTINNLKNDRLYNSILSDVNKYYEVII